MDIRNNKELVSFSAQRVAAAPNEKRVVMIYAALGLGLTALVAAINYALGLLMDQYGGLSNLGTRTMLSTLQTMLPMAMHLFVMCLDLGYLAAALRIARGQYVSAQTLRLGFDRFWVLLRCFLIRGIILMGVMTACVYLGIMVYMMTPLAEPAVELLMPYLSSFGGLDPTMAIDEAVYTQFALAVWPAYLFCGAACLLFGVPIVYSYRMANYIIIDKPGQGALMALRESRSILRGKRLQLLKLDLRLWWWYLAILAVNVLGYGDMILPLVGITLPGSSDVWYFVFYGLNLAATFGLYLMLRSRVEVAYCLAYDAVKPEEKKDGGVVLGNIFQM